MKPSTTLIYLALTAALVGGVGYALVGRNPDALDSTIATSQNATPTPSTAPTVAPTATATPTVSTDLKKEVEVFDAEFAAVTEADFDASSLDDGSIGL
ncbi:hypothetical protein BH11PAT4_BH11PAT4_0460 [soil metagenome]